MGAIVPPLEPSQSGAGVANLQDGLQLLLDRSIIRTVQSPDRPTAEELAGLAVALAVERAESIYGRATERLVQIVQLQNGLGDNLRGVVDDATATVLNELLRSMGAIEDDAGLIVRGTVKTAAGQPIRGAIVRAFDRDLRKEQPLGEVETNDLGEYTIRYEVAQFRSGDLPTAATPHLIVRIFIGDRQIGNDVTRPHPERNEVVDFVKAASTRSEWEELSDGIMALLHGQSEDNSPLPPWEVTDRDLDFLVEETGLEREHVRLWVLAFVADREADNVLAADTTGQKPQSAAVQPVEAGALSSEMFYGWLRQGLPSSLDKLTAIGDGALRQALTTSQVSRAIPPRGQAAIDAAIVAIHALKVARELKSAGVGHSASLGDLLATLPAPPGIDQQRALASAVGTLRADDPHLVEAIADVAGFEGDPVEVARTLRIGALTGGHLPLAAGASDSPPG